MTNVGENPGTSQRDCSVFDAVVVGAGFAGMYMLYSLRKIGVSVRVYEAGSGVGGTWYWNRYPGARCDVESLDYSYSFSEELQQEWHWTERYPSQPEILSYADHVADRFDLRRDIEFATEVHSAAFDAADDRWSIKTSNGQRVTAQFLICAVGCLAAAKRLPDIKGLESFEGRWNHTGQWPHETVDFAGQRVGVIGTGSSGIQAIPVIAREARHLFVFQRTPNFSLPARSGPLDPEIERTVKADYATYRKHARESRGGIPYRGSEASVSSVSSEERDRRFEARWASGGTGLLAAFSDLTTDLGANQMAADFVRRKIAETVRDPTLAALLSPTDHPIGTKRICVDTDYYATYNRSNVTLVDLRATPIEEFVPKGIRTASATYELDSVVFATGFDAMTGPLFRIDICGRQGMKLRDKWQAGPRTYLGVMTAGFPNMFMITAPGSPSVLSNMMVSIEQHVEWIAAYIDYMKARDLKWTEPTIEAEDAWVDHVNEVASRTLYQKANSWYLGANIPGKPRVFMPYVGGVGTYRHKCDDIAANSYEGFVFSP